MTLQEDSKFQYNKVLILILGLLISCSVVKPQVENTYIFGVKKELCSLVFRFSVNGQVDSITKVRYWIHRDQGYDYIKFNEQKIYIKTDQKATLVSNLDSLLQSYIDTSSIYPLYPSYLPIAHYTFILDSNGIPLAKGFSLINYRSKLDPIHQIFLGVISSQNLKFSPAVINGRRVGSVFDYTINTYSDLRRH